MTITHECVYAKKTEVFRLKKIVVYFGKDR